MTAVPVLTDLSFPASGETSQHAKQASAGASLRMLLLIAAVLALWFVLIDQRALIEPDEGRYAEIAREMVMSGDWLTPRLNGLLYFEKPPLHYWASAAAFEIFGQHNGSARLWTVLSGLAGVALVWYAGRRLHSGAAGRYAALILASSVLYFGGAHVNTLDMGVTLFLEAAVLGFVLAMRREASTREEGVWIHVAWLAMGLAVLSKGLIGVVLPAGALICYSVFYRDWGVWKRLHPLTGLPLLVIVAAPWFVEMARAHPDFIQFFFIREHFTRFLTTEHHRYQPWWFFIPVLAVGALPWTLPAAAALGHGLRRRAPAGTFEPYVFLAVWSVVVLIFFSASHSKLVGYILPMFPALALLAGRYVSETAGRTLARQFLGSALVAAVAIGAAYYSGKFTSVGHPADLVASRTPWFVAAAAVWCFASVVAWFAASRQKIDAAVITLAVAMLAANQMMLAGADRMSPVKSSALLAGQIKPRLTPSTRVYVVQMYPQSLPVYLGRTVTLVDYAGELEFGLARQPEKGLRTAAFLDRWRDERDAVAVMSQDTYRAWRAKAVPMELIAQDPARVAVRRP